MPGAADPAGERLRAGGRVLLLLADRVSVSILRSLASGPMDGAELIDQVENVSRSTYFERLRDLEEISLIVRERRSGIPPVAACRLTEAGRCLLRVARLHESWLTRAPDGPLRAGDASAAAATKALALGWGSTLVRWLAERPRSLTELEPLVGGLGYRKRERAIRDLVTAGLAERVAAEGRISPYSVSFWARESIALLAAAVRWERRAIPKRSAPVTATEVEAWLLLALPLVRVRTGSNGGCELLVDSERPETEGPAGVATRIVDGRATLCVPVSESEQQLRNVSWLRGSQWAWFHAVIRGVPGKLETGGDAGLAEALIAGMHEALLVRLASEPGRLFEAA
jgi:DNA-binding HxlR family transcriptional regulator